MYTPMVYDVFNEHVSLNTFLFSGFILALIIYNNAFTKYKIQELNDKWVYLLTHSAMDRFKLYILVHIPNKYYDHSHFF
jgi:hypothetical protein